MTRLDVLAIVPVPAVPAFGCLDSAACRSLRVWHHMIRLLYFRGLFSVLTFLAPPIYRLSAPTYLLASLTLSYLHTQLLYHHDRIEALPHRRDREHLERSSLAQLERRRGRQHLLHPGRQQPRYWRWREAREDDCGG